MDGVAFQPSGLHTANGVGSRKRRSTLEVMRATLLA
jgi:hypothetical protein